LFDLYVPQVLVKPTGVEFTVIFDGRRTDVCQNVPQYLLFGYLGCININHEGMIGQNLDSDATSL
jgi:hypothetical protein